MRRPFLLCLTIALPCVLTGCTGMGVFLDHTFSGFDENPTTPAGNSEVLQRIRGESVNIQPLQPEQGNVWPGPTPPDPTLQDIERQQNSGTPPPVVGGGTDHQQPRPLLPPTGGPSTGATTGPGMARTPRGATGSGINDGSVLIPNGNGTSTMISPDGSVKTVPTPKGQ